MGIRMCIYCPFHPLRVAQAHLVPTHSGTRTGTALALKDSVPSFLLHCGAPRVGHCDSGSCRYSLISYDCCSKAKIPPACGLLHN